MDETIHKQLNDLDLLESNFLTTTTKPLVGYLCMRVPVELIEAHECVPVRIISKPVIQTDGIQTIRNDACSFCRSVPMILNSEPYNRLTAIVAGQCCDQMRRTMDTLDQELTIPAILYAAPRTWDSDKSFFLNEMMRAFTKLSETTGTTLNQSRLEESISLRQQLRQKVIALRESGQLHGKLLHRLSASPLPTVDLLHFLSELNNKDLSPENVRLMLFGSIPSGKELDIIEELGGNVVADATCLGDRIFMPPMDSEDHADPLDFLYDYYIEQNICPHRRPITKLIDYVSSMIEKRNVQGVIYRSVMHCHPFGLTAMRFKNELNVPFLQLDDDLTLQATASFRTRIGAFIEMLVMKKNSRNGSMFRHQPVVVDDR